MNRHQSITQPALAIGFATAVAMWSVGFVTHLPALRTPPPAVAVLLGVTLLVGLTLGARLVPIAHRLRVALASALVAGLVNLLILGSLLTSGEEANALRPNVAVLVLGYVAFNLVAGFVSAQIARRFPERPDAAPEAWLGMFGKVTAASAVPVILSGGLVTSAGAGLAVPDWPNSFSANMFLYPLARMTGGIYYEHAHRLFGSLVGLTTLTLLVFTILVERRTWVKVLVAAAFALVCGQGLLGGLRVISATPTADTTHAPTVDNALSLPLAMVHGVSGQVTFALLCAIAATLCMTWRTIDTNVDDRVLKPFTTAMLIALLLQLGLGAASRHFQHTHALYSHVGFSVLALLAVAFAGFRAAKHANVMPLRKAGNGVVHATVLQMALGLAALFLVLPYDGTPKSPAALTLATLHQANGAFILGTAAALWFWARRLVAEQTDEQPESTPA